MARSRMGRVGARPARQALSADASGTCAAQRRNGRLAPVRLRRVAHPAGPMKRSLRSWLWRVPIEQEVEEELAFHLEMRRREGRAVDPADVERVRQACLEIARRRDREMRLTTWLEERRIDI